MEEFEAVLAVEGWVPGWVPEKTATLLPGSLLLLQYSSAGQDPHFNVTSYHCVRGSLSTHWTAGIPQVIDMVARWHRFHFPLLRTYIPGVRTLRA